ncbi:hypothetical protein D3C77_280660 [compost metagenome]
MCGNIVHRLRWHRREGLCRALDSGDDRGLLTGLTRSKALARSVAVPFDCTANIIVKYSKAFIALCPLDRLQVLRQRRRPHIPWLAIHDQPGIYPLV